MRHREDFELAEKDKINKIEFWTFNKQREICLFCSNSAPMFILIVEINVKSKNVILKASGLEILMNLFSMLIK